MIGARPRARASAEPPARWVLVHPASTKRTAAFLKVDAVDWFADVALLLNAAQFASLFHFLLTSGHFTPASLGGRLASGWALAAAPVFAAGLVFKVSIFTAIGKKGVYYGAKFGHDIPWVHGFPFSVTGATRRARCPSRLAAALLCLASRCVLRRPAHPQYLGSSLCIAAVAVATHDARHPGHGALFAFWALLYVLTGIAEEGLCHSRPPFAALPAEERGAPYADRSSRPVVAAEALRLALMAPIVLVRWCAVAWLAGAYVAAARALRWSMRREPEAAAAAVSRLTRLAAWTSLWVLGFTVTISEEGAATPAGAGAGGARASLAPRGAPKALVASNSLSYLDALLLTAALGPLTPSRADEAAAPGGAAPALAWLLRAARATAPLPPPSSPASPRPSVSEAVVPHASHESGVRLLSFPEGRRTVGGVLTPFSPSAFAARIGPSSRAFAPLVQPVAISYASGNSFNASFVPSLSSAHPSLLPAAVHAFQLTSAWMKEARVAILAPINSTGDTAASAESVAAAATAAVAASLGWPVVDGAGNGGSVNNNHYDNAAAAASPPGSPRAPGRRAAGGRAAASAAVSPLPPVNAGGRARRAAAATAASPGFGGSPGAVRRSTRGAAAKRGDE